MNDKPKMLFLDDRTKRIMSALRQYFGKYDVTIVANVKECLRYLCQQQWDILSLDHDLDGGDFQDPGDTTSGMEVVRYITMTQWLKQYKIPEIWIHSSNLFAANMMIDLLWEAGIKSEYRKFEYDEEKQLCECKPKPKPKPKQEPIDGWIIDKWDSNDFRGYCLSCGKMAPLDVHFQCHDCYIRECKQCM